jgi:hypothetical protein
MLCEHCQQKETLHPTEIALSEIAPGKSISNFNCAHPQGYSRFRARAPLGHFTLPAVRPSSTGVLVFYGGN